MEIAASQPLLPDWDRLAFGFTATDSIYCSYGDSSREPIWDGGEIRGFDSIAFSPAAAFMSYGLGVFEGLKAHRTPDGSVWLFRPDRNAARFRASAERLLLPPFPAGQFVEAVGQLVAHNLRFVPPAGKGAFYVRPTELAVEPRLGAGPCRLCGVFMYGSPVGTFHRDRGGIRLKVLDQARVAAGGTGGAKAMGNYAGGLAILQACQQEGFDDVLYLDARRLLHVTETSGSNFFCLRRDGSLLTPPLDDQILAGVTRDSVLTVARQLLHIPVEERCFDVREVFEEGQELFCTGTAWAVQPVQELSYRGQSSSFPARELSTALAEIITGIMTGTRPDPFGWCHPLLTG